MGAFLGLLTVYLLMNLGLIAYGIGLGFLLHWILPSVELGTCILIAEVATCFSIHYFVRLLWFADFLEMPRFDYGDDSPPIRFYPLGPPRSGRKRKRKDP